MALSKGLFLLLTLISIECMTFSVCAAEYSAASVLRPRFTFEATKVPLSEVIAALATQTRLDVDISALKGAMPVTVKFAKTPFWRVVDELAQQTDSRVVIDQKGKPVALVPLETATRYPAWVDGPFRIAVHQVDARIDLRSRQSNYDLAWEVAWEADLPVFRIDGYPRISKGENDKGGSIGVKGYDARAAVAGNSHQSRIGLTGLGRADQQIAVLEGTFQVTMAEEMLRFTFDNLAAQAKSNQKGVEVELKPMQKKGNYWNAELHLHYPPESAAFESYETYWLSRNRFKLIGPDNRAYLVGDAPEINGSVLVYRFKESTDFKPASLKGWRLEYDTPGIIREVTVKFAFRGLPLP